MGSESVVVVWLVTEASAAGAELEVATEAGWLVDGAAGTGTFCSVAEYSGGPGMM